MHFFCVRYWIDFHDWPLRKCRAVFHFEKFAASEITLHIFFTHLLEFRHNDICQILFSHADMAWWFQYSTGVPHSCFFCWPGCSTHFTTMRKFVLQLFFLLGYTVITGKTQVLSVPEWIEYRFSKSLRIFVSGMSLFLYIATKTSLAVIAGSSLSFFLLGLTPLFWKLIPGSTMLEAFFGWNFALSTFVLLTRFLFFRNFFKIAANVGFASTGVYVLIGGMRAIIYTEVMQTFVLIGATLVFGRRKKRGEAEKGQKNAGGSVVVLYYTLSKVGGWTQLTEQLDPTMLSVWNTAGPYPWHAVLFGYPWLAMCESFVHFHHCQWEWNIQGTTVSIRRWCSEVLLPRILTITRPGIFLRDTFFVSCYWDPFFSGLQVVHSKYFQRCVFAGFLKFLPPLLYAIPGLAARFVFSEPIGFNFRCVLGISGILLQARGQQKRTDEGDILSPKNKKKQACYFFRRCHRQGFDGVILYFYRLCFEKCLCYPPLILARLTADVCSQKTPTWHIRCWCKISCPREWSENFWWEFASSLLHQIGIVVASMLAAVMSTLASVFNSSATLITNDIYLLFRPGRERCIIIFSFFFQQMLHKKDKYWWGKCLLLLSFFSPCCGFPCCFT